MVAALDALLLPARPCVEFKLPYSCFNRSYEVCQILVASVAQNFQAIVHFILHLLRDCIKLDLSLGAQMPSKWPLRDISQSN